MELITRCWTAALPTLRSISTTTIRLLANRPIIFSVCAVSILGAKLCHIYAHVDTLRSREVLLWGSSWFLQDTVLLLLSRILLDLGTLATCATALLAFVLLFLSAGTASFFIVAGTELQFQNVDVIGDPQAMGMLLSGLFSFLVVLAIFIGSAILLQNICMAFANACLDILKWPFSFCRWGRRRRRRTRSYSVSLKSESDYALLLPEDSSVDSESGEESGDLEPEAASWLERPRTQIVLRVLSGLSMLSQVLCSIFRPWDESMIFFSWTLLAIPVVHLVSGSSLGITVALPALFEGITAVHEPEPLSWLPVAGQPGFDDWYTGQHYHPKSDPINVGNLDEVLLPPLLDSIRNVSIKHVMVIKLETTRKDVFPLKRSGTGALIWENLASTFGDHGMPITVQKEFDSLTENARYLTGELDGYTSTKHKVRHGQSYRGGLSFSNAITTASYTLKSLTGTLCGVTPVAADFNQEHNHHIYQPCLAQIFETLNNIDCGDEAAERWNSRWMQSTTLGYDKQDLLMPKLGFPDAIGSEYLREKGHEFPAIAKSKPDVNYYGMEEGVLEPYLRDAFKSAKRDGTRVFLSHLTSTAHHDFGLAKGEQVFKLHGTDDYEMLSRYLNAVGYVDRWLGKILDILDEEEVGDETLIVLVGDHGLGIAEHGPGGSTTPYHDPNIGNFHVPLVISHPSLPKIHINDPVTSVQILPTILDLLIETGSLSQCQSRAAKDLLQVYEGQSLIRPRHSTAGKNTDWQFAIMNPGGSGIAVRDARQPHLRLIVPLQKNTEWRFTNLGIDPHEMDPLQSFDFAALIRQMRFSKHRAHINWVKEAVQVAKWWVSENHKRWRYEG